MTRQKATQPLEMIHADTMGMMSPQTYPKGYKYMTVFVYDYSRLAMTFPMRTKDVMGKCFEEFVKGAWLRRESLSFKDRPGHRIFRGTHKICVDEFGS